MTQAEKHGRKKAPPERGLIAGRDSSSLELHGRDVRRLKALWTLDHVEPNSLPLGERTEALHLDLTEVDEEILPLRLLNESVALLGTKPLDSPLSQPYNLHLFRGDTIPGPPLSNARGPVFSRLAALQ
jgi:hypothetical protein